MAAPYQPPLGVASAAGPSRPYYRSDSTLHQHPSFPLSDTPSPSYSPNTEQETWPSNGGAEGRLDFGAPGLGSIQMPDPSRPSSASGSGSGPASDDRAGGEGSKRNPLVDLIDSEKTYVEQLGLVIRRVAAAWSRKDFPPPRLDTMFRCVEAVYRANRGFGQKLKEIGPNPSSPKALGDLLMRWIDDLEPAYHKYSTNFLTGFDSYTPVTRNALLPGILSDISVSSAPSPPLTHWTLDALFILPYTRLRYYRKLYARLLRSTKEGRSDHRLLVVANERLDGLVNEVESRLEMDVSEEDGQESGSSGQRSREQSWAEREKERERISRTSSALDSSLDSHTNRIEDRNSGGSVATSITQSPQRRPTPTINVPVTTGGQSPISPMAPISDLELRIDPERTIDLFTMQLKKCKLQMNPPNLPFVRALRSSHDVTIHFIPNSTGKQVIHQRAHIFILSDLFLIAEWMEVSDKAAKAQQVAREQPERVGHGGPMPEMWLSYPPLAGKHLMVAEGQQANILTVMIMRKETFVVHAESELARDQIMKDLIDCIDFASLVGRPGLAQSTAPSPIDARSPSAMSDGRSMDGQFPPLRYPSPFSAGSSPATSPRPSDMPEMPPMPLGGNALVSQMSKISLEPGEAIAWPRGPSPPGPQQQQAQQPAPIAALPPRGASLRTRAPSGNMGPPPLPSDSQGGPQPPPKLNLNFPEPSIPGAQLPRSPSGRSVQSAPRPNDYDMPPVPQMRGAGSHLSDQGHPSPFSSQSSLVSRSRSLEPLRPIDPPSARFSSFPGRASPLAAGGNPEDDDNSPPMSPVEEEAATLTGPAIISAQMKCKVFLKQSHQQWKSLGSGKLKLYAQQQGNVKQLVVESDSSSKNMLISTIVLTDGVERVAKTGVAVEISDRGKRTGIIYMIQLRNENSAMGLFESLLAGSDRAVVR
ncbi:hypothetical protein IAR55_005834 [Kwoniella newhampshirensis]|uniref:DH domain-containing protein n=1 Tax=Kwoniella newhampshirensis TaxID=1651941 RepID=A0AAW0YL15_9TREE